MFVVTGSFDIFHNGHKSLIKQVSVLSKSVGDEFFFVLIMEDHPIKEYLFEPIIRFNIVKTWVEKEHICAKVCLVKCTDEKKADEDFYNAVGLKPTDESVIIVNGIKEGEIEKNHIEMINFGYNKFVNGKKKIFLVSNEEESRLQSSSYIKEYIINNLDDKSKFFDSVNELFGMGVIDELQRKYILQSEDTIKERKRNGTLIIDNNIPFPKN